jgi:Leucine-rich repeat (LRR) protein
VGPPADESAAAEVEAATAVEATFEPATELVVAHAAQIGARTDTAALRHLDLALSPIDARERIDVPLDPGLAATDPCAGLDLHVLAERMPRLTSLRISGCQAAVDAGLDAFAGTVEQLELADLVLDSVTVGRLVRMKKLGSLTLTRVNAGSDPLEQVGQALRIESITLRELERDSVVGDVLGDLPTLRRARIEGAWAGHRAMLSLAKARALTDLALVDTSVGNFALNQIEPLSQLRRIDWTGATFNDHSPLYLRKLPIEQFRCACPELGDTGLRHLRHLPSLRVLDLPTSRITSAGLANLEPLSQLEEIRILHRDVDASGFAALARLPALRRLTLGRTRLGDPAAEHLGELQNLAELVLQYENFDDHGARQLAGLTRLRTLDLGFTAVSDAGLGHLTGLTELEVLRLHHTRVTNRGLAHLAGLRRLAVLELDHTDLVDEGVAHLAELTSLTDLRLDHTLITDRALGSLRGLSRLERLNLENTVVTPAGALQLRELPALHAVNLAGTRARPAQAR